MSYLAPEAIATFWRFVTAPVLSVPPIVRTPEPALRDLKVTPDMSALTVVADVTREKSSGSVATGAFWSSQLPARESFFSPAAPVQTFGAPTT